MNNKNLGKIKVNSFRCIVMVILILSALLSSIVPVYAEGVKKPTVSKPSVGQAPVMEENNNEPLFGSMFENGGANEESVAEKDDTAEDSSAVAVGNILTNTMLSMFLSVAGILGVLCLSLGIVSLIRNILLEDADGKSRAIVMTLIGVVMSVAKAALPTLLQVA